MVPKLVKRVQVEIEGRGKTYEEKNWAKLSPLFREAHNKLRVRKGLSEIPPPKIDLYVPPKMRKMKPLNLDNNEARATVREFLGPTLMIPGAEGFTIGGEPGDAFLRRKQRAHTE